MIASVGTNGWFAFV